MSRHQIEFKEGTDIPLDILQQLFRKEQWNDFFDREEIQIHLDRALYLVSAWDGQELVGYARLGGDGRIAVEISDVLVISEYQGMGIGTELVKRVVVRIKELDPYFVQVEPIDHRSARLYTKFGFREIRDYRRMELITQKLIDRLAEVRGEKRTKWQT